MSVFMLPAAPGCCPVCSVKHTSDAPHNAQSLSYQVRFKATHGRDATWADAVAHCLPAVQCAWKEALTSKGYWTEPAGGMLMAIAESMDMLQSGKPIPLPSMEPTVVKMGRKKKKNKLK